MAEVLSQAGYATAFYGKSHMGDVESSYLNAQGFDEALWTPYNQVPSMYPPEFERMGAIRPGSLNDNITPTDPYDLDKGWKPKGYVWALEGVKGGPVSEWGTAPNIEDYIAMDGESQKPFYAAYWPQMTPFTGFPEKLTVSAGMLQEAIARFDIYVGELMKELQTLGIEENTLVVMMADNGPMVHHGHVGMVETLYRGGKGDFLEGGVRVTAHARWLAWCY